MDKDLAEVIKEACALEDIEVDILEEYSGRGMFGKGTTALVGDLTLHSLPGVILAHAELFVDGGESMFCEYSFSQDNMGKDKMVVY